MAESVFENLSLYATGTFLVVCLILYIISRSFASVHKVYQLPPGPKGWPLIGSLAHLSGDGRNDYLINLVEKYSDIFSLRLGFQRVVVVNKYDAMRSLLLDGHVLSERAPIESLDRYFKGRGIAGAKFRAGWKHIRQFTHSIFRSLGVPHMRFQDNILTEMDFMVVEIEQYIGNKEEFDPMNLFNTTTANIIGSMIYGQRFDRNDETFQTMKDALHRSLRLVQYCGASTFLPFMRYLPTLPGLKAFYREMDTAIKCQQVFISKYKNKYKQGDQGQKQANIIDAYLNQVSLWDTSPSCNDESLAFVINDLFLAGTETSATVLTWAILALLLHPDIQKKIHQEIDSQICTDRQITVADKPRLPYTQAVILESLRYGSVVPVVMRSTTQDTSIKGYDLPVGTIVMLNYYYGNFDPEVWQDPFEFKPQRFLNEEGQLIHQKELIPFSIGRRSCLGDNLAKMEIFLIFSNLLKSYHLEPSAGAQLTLQTQPGMTRCPFPYKIRASNRGNCMRI